MTTSSDNMLPPVADFDDLPVWINDPEFRQPRFEGDPRCRRSVMARLKAILSLTDGHRPFRWGFAIVRTAYGPGSDEQFRHAINIINRVAKVWADDEANNVKENIMYCKDNSAILDHIPVEVDMRPNEEFLRRFENDILEDKEALENASSAAVRAYFKKWISSKRGTALIGDMRFAACVMLDAETLEQFAAVPEGFPRDTQEGYRSSYWLKLVDTDPNPDEAVRVRVYGHDDLMKYWFDRNFRQRPMSEMTHRSDRENPGVLYFGKPRLDIPRITRET
ncbi:hypothetical protein FPOAC1_000139 [Fusarium poae]|uniref:hypothetical protein n=1 Tax=Fusarium poae TaxID=36050 RepID=UPI001CE98382|nr:hypothetical protein FPOAC1_000139 [Fusarium poae]KAG8674176.1 hypothetical protein FPOAC1_000139 [Fusarium poae]